MMLKKRLFLYLLLISVIPVIIVGGISYFLAVGNITENAIKSNLSVANRVSSDVEKMFGACFNMAYSLEDSIPYQEAMRLTPKNDEERFTAELKTSLDMYVEAKYYPEIFGIYLISERGCSYKSSFCTFVRSDLLSSEIYKKAAECEDMTYLGSYSGSQIVSSLDYPMLVFGMAYRDKASGGKIGAVIIEIEREKVINMLNFDLGASGYIATVDGSDKLVASVGDDTGAEAYLKRTNITPKSYIHDDGRESLLYGESPIVIKNAIPNTEFSIICVVPETETVKNAQYISIVISFLCFIMIVAAFLFAWNISDKVTKPIKKLVGLMHRVEKGDLTVSFAPKYEDEIGMLFRSFNIMVEKVNTLMTSIQDEQNKLRASEMRALMSQINPHFLYNTLDSIVWLCRAGDTRDAAAMTDSLASFFRIGLSKGRDIITVREETEHAKSYLNILDMRGRDKFIYNIDVDEELYECSTVKFVLQPLVENAIFHGVEKITDGKKGYIGISVYEEDETVVLSVSDNGPGMMPEAEKRLRSTLKTERQGSNESYGLVNVNRRIKGLMGEEYGLRFFTVYGKGSTFEIVIPKQTEV